MHGAVSRFVPAAICRDLLKTPLITILGAYITEKSQRQNVLRY